MAQRELTAQEQIIEEGLRAKEEHAAKHGDDSPTSAAATAQECADLGKELGFGTYEQDAPTRKAQRPVEDKAATGPKE